MEQKLNISISKPCAKKFNDFTQTTTGGFCKSCNKNVTDFRNMSDEKLTTYFRENGERTCGYFNAFQLKESLLSDKKSLNN